MLGSPATRESLPQLKHGHGDETGWRIDGVRHWAWILATASITFIFIAASRGAEVLKSLLGDAFTGLISCDFYNAYRAKDGVGGERTFCWAHLDREAKGVIENGWGDTAEFGRALRRIINQGCLHWRGLMRRRIGEDVYQRRGERLKARMKEILDEFDGKLIGDKQIALRRRLAENLDGYFNWYLPYPAPDTHTIRLDDHDAAGQVLRQRGDCRDEGRDQQIRRDLVRSVLCIAIPARGPTSGRQREGQARGARCVVVAYVRAPRAQDDKAAGPRVVLAV